MNCKILGAAAMALASLAASADKLGYDAAIRLGGEWTLTQADNEAVTCPITVPGGVHTALLRAGEIPDPYFGRNENLVQWVGRKDWIVEREFDVSEELLEKKSLVLRLDKVDTVAEIYVNDKKAGETCNSFRRYDFDVKALLRPGKNTFKAVFRSAEKYAYDLGAKKYRNELKMDRDGTVPDLHLLRKTACHGGWDWGLAMMVIGFVDEPVIVGTDVARIDYVYCDQDFNADLSEVGVTVNAEVFSPEGGEVELKARLACGDSIAARGVVVRLKAGMNRVSVPLVVRNPSLWWPNGEGRQNLYDLRVAVGGATLERRVGLRKLEIVNEKDKWGTSMSIRVNGKDVFAKGADWIPCDAFINRQTPERIRNLVFSAKEANMNAIRVWGGGQYERDAFYEACDEAGIMLWHDFMFACWLFPSDADFLAETGAEFAHQIRRLRDHASIALWCGDNECLGAIGWYQAVHNDRDGQVAKWNELNKVREAAVKKYDPARTYWPSSPCGGPGNFSDGWHNDAEGDLHYWDVWHGNQPFSDYYSKKPRFCSEFGFQSYPSKKVAQTFCPEGKAGPGFADFEHHQKNVGGNRRIARTMERYFTVPKTGDGMLYISQVQQSLAIKTAVEYWRTLRPRCMGTIVWQLNDDWPVSSWSSLEYGGKWKHLHYAEKRFFAPIAVVAVPEDGDETKDVGIWALNDTDETVKAPVTIETWKFDGTKCEGSTDVEAVVPPRSVARVTVVRRGGVDTFLVMKGLGPDNHYLFGRYKDAKLPASKVSVQVVDGGRGVKLSADRPAFFVWMEGEGEFTDNSFLLLPGTEKTVECRGWTAKQPPSVTHLGDPAL